jgi:hypothetical protein
MEIIEIYVLCKERTKKLVLEFLESVLPNRKEVAENYPYPEYADEYEHIYEDFETLLEALEINTRETYSLYWDSANHGEVRSAMVFFTEDGYMIAGITVADDTERRKNWLNKLSRIVDGEYGYVSFDTPPPLTSREFIDYCEKSDQVRLISRSIV